MLVYQDWVEGLGIQNGGSDDPKDWTTAITVDSSDTSQHRHSMSDVTDPADLPKAGGITNDNDANSEHSHGVGQDTWTPKYQEVILGTKD
jgi:hypothetical protein